VAAGRRRCGRLVRRRHRAFFSTTPEANDDGRGVAEDAPELGAGDKAREAVDVQESLEFWHPRIVTGLAKRRKANFAGKTRGKFAPAIESYPRDFTKSPIYEGIINALPCFSVRFVNHAR